MLLVVRFIVAFALFAPGATSPMLEETARGLDDSAMESSMSTEAAHCEPAAGESLHSSASEVPGATLAQGYCYSDCSPCFTREDCISPEFPHGAACTSIPLC